MSNTGYIGSSRSVALYDAPSRSQFEGHLLEEGGIHGIPLNARSIHSEELLNAVSTATTTAEAVSMTGKGAIVESGSTPDGHYVRWENGEQVCSKGQLFGNLGANESRVDDWTYPVAFYIPIDGNARRDISITASMVTNVNAHNVSVARSSSNNTASSVTIRRSNTGPNEIIGNVGATARGFYK